jgi:hypothetical protein
MDYILSFGSFNIIYNYFKRSHKTNTMLKLQ